MEPRSSAVLHRWRVYVLWVILFAAAFAVGRYWATRSVEANAVLSEKKAMEHSVAPAKAHSLSPAVTLAQARADLAKILRLGGKYDRERALLALAAKLDPPTLQSLLAELEPQADQGNNNEAISILAAQWAETDPQAALNSLKGVRNAYSSAYSLGRDFIQRIFETWSAKDPAAALAAIAQLPANGQGDAFKAVMENMIAQNPQSALSALLSQPLGKYSVSLDAYLFSELAYVNPAATAAAALNLPPSSLRNGVLADVADAWATLDPTGALAWANALPPGQAKDGVVKAVVETWGQQDPTVAAAYVLQIPAGSSRDYLMETVSQSWAQVDPTGLLTWAGQNLTGQDYVTAAYNALNMMGESDPAAEAAALTQISDPKIANAAIRGLARNWAEQDIPAGLAWAESLPADNAATRSAAISSILNVWAGTDPASAAAYISQNLSTDSALGALAGQVLNSWGVSDPQAALAWVQSLPPGSAQNSLLETALGTLADVDPQVAWANAAQLTSSTQGNAQVEILNSWSKQQPADAAAALANVQLSGNTLTAATADVVKNWLNQDPQSAAQWINTLPPGSARDGAVEQIVSTVGPNDPASAYTWATTIGNDASRNTEVVKTATQWSNQNPAAAAAAAQNALSTLTGLTAAQTTALQNIVNKASAP